MAASIRSYAKINLGLAIGPARGDGFHGLTTVYQTLALHDIVTVEARRAASTSIRLTSTHPHVPADARNTAWRMVEQALGALGVAAEVHIHLEKRLPVQGGLGGGSGNAVAALIGLENELEGETGVRLSGQERLRLAAGIGSDVPLFLLGGAVAGVGRGEEVYPLPDAPSMPCVLALPEIGVSTAQAYRDWDALQADALTASAASATIGRLSRSIAAAFSEPYSSGVFSTGEGQPENPLLALVRTGIENDFERVVFPQYPFLGAIKRILADGSPDRSSDPARAEESSVYAALSGSGSALFGLYRSVEAAESAMDRLRAQGIAGVLTRTLPRDEYWGEMRVPQVRKERS
ncbi:MAG TPA: 4-(cytidine 5'-diphospho)-2-C-methyl-D-erythritol kinase [Acidobacteriaceae bacterium]|nr:4-(cytidine 5'-diphospho)-2-C-methyl-D-erythritol kinase [Acidobacteriaceae bacterium]